MFRSDWRPISKCRLASVDYKLVIKMLGLGMKQVLTSIINIIHNDQVGNLTDKPCILLGT